MYSRISNNPSANEQEDSENSPENSAGSPRSPIFSDAKMTSVSTPSKRRAIQRRVVSVPIRDAEGSRLKGETAPPSDSWAWRKYGQKPIKGSPYPRGYYRCSSSKGCPARKQVERSREDPTLLVVTYAFEHNHPSPAGRINGHNHRHANTSTMVTTAEATSVSNSDDEKTAISENQPQLDPSETFTDLGEESLVDSYGFKWFSDLETTSSSTMLESPILGSGEDNDGAALVFPMREEDESMFADLGELPECSAVFRRGAMEREEERRQCNLAPSCG
ncbi:hypothetical protein NMG60_11015014 [Bertholletia excelsa]